MTSFPLGRRAVISRPDHVFVQPVCIKVILEPLVRGCSLNHVSNAFRLHVTRFRIVYLDNLTKDTLVKEIGNDEFIVSSID